jgi:hypothetical protein
MNNSVIITADNQNNVIRLTKNPEYGWILVSQTTPVFKGRFIDMEKRTAIITGKVDFLKQMDYKASQELPGKIVVKESLEPTNPDNNLQDVKCAGDSNIPCTVDDQPIYRTSYYTINLSDTDILIEHDNGDEIRAAQKKERLTLGATL